MKPKRKQGAIFSSPSGQETGLTFEEAFPTVETVLVEISEIGEGNRGLGMRRFSKNSIREYVNCSNHLCEGKGVALGAELRDMMDQRLAQRQLSIPCQSREEKGKACPNHFVMTLQLTYKK